jgi:magnesium-transporting ATPase (P-type)
MPIMIWIAIIIGAPPPPANCIVRLLPALPLTSPPPPRPAPPLRPRAEFAIKNWIDAGILLGIQFANATLGWYETVKAADAVAALKASLKPLATCKRDGTWANMDATKLVPGDLVLLGAGSAVPADCIVNEGRIEVDQSALTGESLPVTMRKVSARRQGLPPAACTAPAAARAEQ